MIKKGVNFVQSRYQSNRLLSFLFLFIIGLMIMFSMGIMVLEAVN